MAGKKSIMFTAERVALMLLAVAFIVWACIVIIDKRSPEATPPVTVISIDSVTGTISSDSLTRHHIYTKRQPSGKKATGRKGAAKKKKGKESKGKRDHLHEPIPQEE